MSTSLLCPPPPPPGSPALFKRSRSRRSPLRVIGPSLLVSHGALPRDPPPARPPRRRPPRRGPGWRCRGARLPLGGLFELICSTKLNNCAAFHHLQNLGRNMSLCGDALLRLRHCVLYSRIASRGKEGRGTTQARYVPKKATATATTPRGRSCCCRAP